MQQEVIVKKSNFDLERLQSAERLKANENFTPCPINEGDELYPNGIFVFNITKMIEHIKINSDEIDLVEVAVADFPKSFSSVNESHVDSVDISRPVLLAEISPGHYNLIDGNHRMEKARKKGISRILAYKLNVNQHIEFLTERKAYLSYVEYWNGKLK
jgi:hypothetical protein